MSSSGTAGRTLPN